MAATAGGVAWRRRRSGRRHVVLCCRHGCNAAMTGRGMRGGAHVRCGGLGEPHGLPGAPCPLPSRWVRDHEDTDLLRVGLTVRHARRRVWCGCCTCPIITPQATATVPCRTSSNFPLAKASLDGVRYRHGHTGGLLICQLATDTSHRTGRQVGTRSAADDVLSTTTRHDDPRHADRGPSRM